MGRKTDRGASQSDQHLTSLSTSQVQAFVLKGCTGVVGEPVSQASDQHVQVDVQVLVLKKCRDELGK